MENAGVPILSVGGTLTENDYKAAVRARGVRDFLTAVLIWLLIMLLLVFGYGLYKVSPYLKSGELTFGEWLDELWNVLSTRKWTLTIAGCISLYAVLVLLVRPSQMVKRMRERYPTGIPFVYDFYEDELVIRSSSRSGDETVRLLYTEVQRRIKDRKYVITLSTGRKNRFGLFKAIMTPQEVTAVLELLKARCPQRKS